jgi:branched-chain amino acid transport system permease protein
MSDKDGPAGHASAGRMVITARMAHHRRRRLQHPIGMITIVLDGIAYGLLLFILAAGLSITLGLMNFVNLAHGAFAMFGGYATVVLLNRYGVPFLACLPVAFLLAGAIGLLLERTLYVRLYRRSDLDQVLFTIGLVFMASAAIDYFFGSSTELISLPPLLTRRLHFLGASLGVYELFTIIVCALLTIGLQLVLARTRFGSRLRAAVDDQATARGLGIDVDRLFALTFAFGSGLAGLGGALGLNMLGMDPTFPIKYMIYFLIVVVVGGTTSMTGPFLAAIILGVADLVGKYYIPSIGAFIIYGVMVFILIVRPQGLFGRPAGHGL